MPGAKQVYDSCIHTVFILNMRVSLRPLFCCFPRQTMRRPRFQKPLPPPVCPEGCRDIRCLTMNNAGYGHKHTVFLAQAGTSRLSRSWTFFTGCCNAVSPLSLPGHGEERVRCQQQPSCCSSPAGLVAHSTILVGPCRYTSRDRHTPAPEECV